MISTQVCLFTLLCIFTANIVTLTGECIKLQKIHMYNSNQCFCDKLPVVIKSVNNWSLQMVC